MLPVYVGSVKDLISQKYIKGSIFVWGPLHYYVLLFSIFGAVGLFRSDMLLIFTWFGHDSPAGQFVCPQFPYRGNDTIFWIFPIVPCHAFCM